MKDLTHYFNSPPQKEKIKINNKTPDDEFETCNTKKRSKKSRNDKKRKDKVSLFNTEDVEKHTFETGSCDSDVKLESDIVLETNQLHHFSNSSNDTKNLKLKHNDNVSSNNCFDDSNEIENIEFDVSFGSGNKKRKRKTNLVQIEPNKRVKRKIEKGRLKIVSSITSENSELNDKIVYNESVSEHQNLENSCNLIKKKSDLISEPSNAESEILDDFSDNNFHNDIKPKRKKSKTLETSDNRIVNIDNNLLQFVENKNEVKLKRKKKKKKHKNEVSNCNVKEEYNGNISNIKEINSSSTIVNTDPNYQEHDLLEPKSYNESSENNIYSGKSETEKRNSLFNYYTKVDKATFQANNITKKIQVKAMVHTPPNQKSKSSPDEINSSTNVFKKQLKHKKQILKEADEITVLSSEIITDLNDINSNIEEMIDHEEHPRTGFATPSKSVCISRSDWKMRVQLSSKLQNAVESVIDSDECKIVERDSKIQEKSLSSGKSNKIKTTNNSEKSSDAKHKSKKKCLDINKCIDEESDDDNKTAIKSSTKGVPASNQSKTIQNSSSNGSTNKKSPSGADIMAKFLGRCPKEVKPSVDSAVLIAKQKFLESGVPDVIRIKSDGQSEKIVGLPAPFPKVSHIQQRNPIHIIWNLSAPCIKLYSSSNSDLDLQIPKWNLAVCKSKSSERSCHISNINCQPPLVLTTEQKKCMKRLKKSVTTLEVGQCWDTILEMKAAAAASSDIWTDVYKPRKASDFISNVDNIQKLKSWMVSFKNNGADKPGDSSGEEFVDSDLEDKASSLSSTCIISGPNGCGKTSAVFAVANELGYKVFEINASCNRNGKRVLTNLSEATQSHQVEHSQTFFEKGKERVKKNKKSKEMTAESSSKKRSLILVEDADLLFNDKDEGFIPAIATLASSSKRPLVLIVNDMKPPHLAKLFDPSQLKLNFSRPSPVKLGLWLQLIALAGGMQLSSGGAQKLAHWCDCDIRKSLLQLQLLVQSHSKTEKSWPGITDSPVWVSPVSYIHDKQEALKDKRTNKEIIKNQLKSVVLLSQSLVTYDLLMNSNSLISDRMKDPCPAPCKALPSDSTSLLDCSERLLTGSNLSCHIADYLYESIATCTSSQLRSQNQLQKTDDDLMSALPLYSYCSHDAVFSDYFPTLRLFGRVEKNRLALHSKRTCRFFNYLNALGVNASDSGIKYICDTFT
ncbi:enhanced level of genomic instability 1 isoform X2 [Lycorma delicatula]|uniref:enhanced level of genomic instability 1 isoform X2 n=1 Tax=Lycorma delicatula TaxID=130591 RepID=UPI003F5123F9